MKILYVTTVSGTMSFFPKHFEMLLGEGHAVELACNCEKPVPQALLDMGLTVHHIPFSRAPFSKSNLSALKQIKKLIADGGYDLVHTHTPNASVCVRLSCRKLRKKGLKVVYTAHGFHFYKGAPLKNWLLYYPIERICSRWTDTLITINREDYELAKHKMKAKEAVYIPGIGVDLCKFQTTPWDRKTIREEFSVAESTTLLIYIAELNQNKNQSSLLDMLHVLKKRNRDVKLMLVGSGAMLADLQEKCARLGIENDVIFTGFRRDVPALLAASDIAVPSSIREGLGLNLLEAMACDVPVVAYTNRGHASVIENEKNGFLVKHGDHEEMANKVEMLMGDKDLYDRFVQAGRERVKVFGIDHVLDIMRHVYDI